MSPDEKGGMRTSLKHLIDGNSVTQIGKKKHRLRFIMLTGVVLIILAFFISICIGPTALYAPWDAVSHIISSLGGGVLSTDEIIVFNSRTPRTLAAICVGTGLAIAGAAYQAIIRNPLVDPYIMGVSSGAGTFAVAVIGFNFTLFGLIPANSPYLTAICAIVGGLLAFALTMILAQRAGGTTNAYVLSGVVIGLIFSAVQTVMIIFAGDHVSNALLWLFGSFSSVTWIQTAYILMAVVVLSAIIMRYSKELNLILLGESQARQMGLNVKRFNAVMLIVASVLTAFCVAFVGVIGFVGLVVPHLCRMLFGGDHRLVLPASIFFGSALMIMADLLSRMLIPGLELPVGAITTIIGVPIFAYLLFMRGKMYNG